MKPRVDRKSKRFPAMVTSVFGGFSFIVFSSLQVEEFNDKQKEVEAVCNPIITKMYQSAGGDPGKGLYIITKDDFRSRPFLSRGGSRNVT